MIERLSRDDLVRVIDLSRRCLSVASDGELLAVLERLAALTGHERVAIGTVGGGGAGDVQHHLDHSFGAWAHVYVSRRFARLDHVLRHACRVGGAVRWSDASSAPRDPGFYEAAREHGVLDGITYAAPGAGGADWTVLPLGSPRDRDAQRALEVVSALGPHVHEAYARLRHRERARDAAGAAIRLSPREREILAWIQDGKTSWEIGLILGISERTVKYHCARLQAKLGVVSRSHAVAKAMRLGLLD